MKLFLKLLEILTTNFMDISGGPGMQTQESEELMISVLLLNIKLVKRY